MDALELLTADHNRVRGLFTRFKAAKEADDLDTMTVLCRTILNELEVHTTIEEEIFYPAFREAGSSGKADDMTLEAYEEHHVVKLLLEEVPDIDPEDESFDAKVTVLKEIIEHHVEEEQDEMFPMAEKKLGADGLKALGERMQARMDELQGSPSSRPAARSAR